MLGGGIAADATAFPMLFKSEILRRIGAGEVTLAFRRWRRPTVRAGSELRTAVGVLRITAMREVDWGEVTLRDAQRAGYPSREVLRDALAAEGRLYRIELERAGDDPRLGLRERTDFSAEERLRVGRVLARWDAGGAQGAWTERVLREIARAPGVRAAELAARLGYEKDWLKPKVRQLKELGLTISEEVGYRLSPRGEAWLAGGGDRRG